MRAALIWIVAIEATKVCLIDSWLLREAVSKNRQALGKFVRKGYRDHKSNFSRVNSYS